MKTKWTHIKKNRSLNDKEFWMRRCGFFFMSYYKYRGKWICRLYAGDNGAPDEIRGANIKGTAKKARLFLESELEKILIDSLSQFSERTI